MITKTLDENTISLMPEDSDDLLTVRRILKNDDKMHNKIISIKKKLDVTAKIIHSILIN